MTPPTPPSKLPWKAARLKWRFNRRPLWVPITPLLKGAVCQKAIMRHHKLSHRERSRLDTKKNQQPNTIDKNTSDSRTRQKSWENLVSIRVETPICEEDCAPHKFQHWKPAAWVATLQPCRTARYIAHRVRSVPKRPGAASCRRRQSSIVLFYIFFLLKFRRRYFDSRKSEAVASLALNCYQVDKLLCIRLGLRVLYNTAPRNFCTFDYWW